MTSEPVWRHGNLVMTWNTDSSGNDRPDLYLDKIWIGYVTRFKNPNRVTAPWRAWLMTDEEGDGIGWHPTREAAQSALVEAAVKALLGDADG